MAKKNKKRTRSEIRSPPQSRPREFSGEQINLFKEGKSRQIFDELLAAEVKKVEET